MCEIYKTCIKYILLAVFYSVRCSQSSFPYQKSSLYVFSLIFSRKNLWSHKGRFTHQSVQETLSGKGRLITVHTLKLNRQCIYGERERERERAFIRLLHLFFAHERRHKSEKRETRSGLLHSSHQRALLPPSIASGPNQLSFFSFRARDPHRQFDLSDKSWIKMERHD